MSASLRTRSTAAVALAAAAVSFGAAVPADAAAKSCKKITNPYAGTRYEGADLRAITATGVSCATARKVVRGAHKTGLGITPPVSGIRRYSWKGWKVTGNLRGDSDRYVAKRGSDRVRWRF